MKNIVILIICLFAVLKGYGQITNVKSIVVHDSMNLGGEWKSSWPSGGGSNLGNANLMQDSTTRTYSIPDNGTINFINNNNDTIATIGGDRVFSIKNNYYSSLLGFRVNSIEVDDSGRVYLPSFLAILGNNVLSLSPEGFITEKQMGADTTLYKKDGSLTGNRIVDLNGHRLSFAGAAGFDLQNTNFVSTTADGLRDIQLHLQNGEEAYFSTGLSPSGGRQILFIFDSTGINLYAFGSRIFSVDTLGDIRISLTNNLAEDSVLTTTATGDIKFKYYPDMVKGTATFSGDGSTTEFVVNHSLGVEPAQVFLQATSNAGFVTDKTDTTFTITTLSPPPPGTDNLVFYWIAYK